MPDYSVTKAAVLSLSRLVADLYAKDGIRCNAVSPGPTAIAGLARRRAGSPTSRPRAPARRASEVLADVGAGRPLGRLARARGDRRGDRVPLLARASYVTGAAWSADGGTVPIII